MNIDTVLNQQEVIERKVKELNTLVRESVNYGACISIDAEVIELSGGKRFTQLIVDFKINPKDLKL
ncbi:hypothetical protein [Flyfo podovirus Tbat2_2]|nr:hypothetical protein [Flyfo podovirus Tbat2_2]